MLNIRFRDGNCLGITQLFHFALVIVRLPGTKRYLLVQEFANAGFWCPGGAVDIGESFQSAALRECMEEAGMPIILKGILSVEVHNTGDYPRSRIVHGKRVKLLLSVRER